MCQTTRPRGWDSADSEPDNYDIDKYWYTDDEEEEFEREREYRQSDYHFVDRLLGDMLFKNGGVGMAGRGEGRRGRWGEEGRGRKVEGGGRGEVGRWRKVEGGCGREGG